jgi:endonuclease/exonuclease/phosphatase family metal-dependent hydrolase
VARPWIVIVGSLVACVLLTGSTIRGLPPDRAGVAGGISDTPVRILQMNLCASGFADCYTGKSVLKAAAVIRAEAPDVVTLNEVCKDDVSTLERALAAETNGVVVSAFQAAADRRTGRSLRCRDGRPYGIGLVSRLRVPLRGYTAVGGTYPMQDRIDPEERAWLCLDARVAFTVCTTHLDNASSTVARAQCDYLLETAIPSVRPRGGTASFVVAGDLNLRSGGFPDVRSCLRAGDQRADDGGVQHVVTTRELAITSFRSISMDRTTDHPGLLVTLAPRGNSANARPSFLSYPSSQRAVDAARGRRRRICSSSPAHRLRRPRVQEPHLCGFRPDGSF